MQATSNQLSLLAAPRTITHSARTHNHLHLDRGQSAERPQRYLHHCLQHLGCDVVYRDCDSATSHSCNSKVTGTYRRMQKAQLGDITCLKSVCTSSSATFRFQPVLAVRVSRSALVHEHSHTVTQLTFAEVGVLRLRPWTMRHRCQPATASPLLQQWYDPPSSQCPANSVTSEASI